MKKPKVKDKRFPGAAPPPTPIPVPERCTFTGDESWAVRCSHRAEFLLQHDEFCDDEPPQFCSNHIGLALTELIPEACGIDELTILRYPFFQVTT